MKEPEGIFCLVSMSLGPISNQLGFFFGGGEQCCLFKEGKSSILKRSGSF